MLVGIIEIINDVIVIVVGGVVIDVFGVVGMVSKN